MKIWEIFNETIDNENHYSRNYLYIQLHENGVFAHISQLFDIENDEIGTASCLVDPQAFLESIAKARLGERCIIPSSSTTYNGWSLTIDQDYINIQKNFYSLDWALKSNFDSIFLDTFSVLENSEVRKRESRDIKLTIAEETIIDIIRGNPNLVYNFSPREFEVVVAALLAKLGFSNIKLSRYSKDSGIDLLAVYFEGDQKYTVVVEVKLYSKKKVGLAIVDRLNGVRERENKTHGLIITSSSFSIDAIKNYESKKSSISLVDFDKLVNLISKSNGQWECTPSGLWTIDSKNK